MVIESPLTIDVTKVAKDVKPKVTIVNGYATEAIERVAYTSETQQQRQAIKATCKQIKAECEGLTPSTEIVLMAPVLNAEGKNIDWDNKLVKDLLTTQKRFAFPLGFTTSVFIGRVRASDGSATDFFARLHANWHGLLSSLAAVEFAQYHFGIVFEREEGEEVYFELAASTMRATVQNLKAGILANGKQARLSAQDMKALKTLGTVLQMRPGTYSFA